MSAADKDAALLRVKGSTVYDDLKSCDLVIEAATEYVDLKLKIIRLIDGLAKSNRLEMKRLVIRL